MNIELRAILAAIAEKAFTGESGEAVTYNEIYFQYEDDDGSMAVSKVNTKQDLKGQLRQKGVAKISVQENGKMKLVSFKSTE